MINRMVFDRELGPGKSFLDIGHGIGNLCLQAAYMFGCRAKGIEIDEGRNSVAIRLKSHFESICSQQKETDQMQFKPGQIDFIQGGLEEPAHRTFLVEDTDFTIVNNFGKCLKFPLGFAFKAGWRDLIVGLSSVNGQ